MSPAPRVGLVSGPGVHPVLACGDHPRLASLQQLAIDLAGIRALTRRSLLGCRDQAKSFEQAGSEGSSRPGVRGPRPRNQDEGQSQSGSHCILLENIDIYFSSQLELNTILPGLKKQNKTKTQTLRNVHSFTPTCPFPQLWAGSPAMPRPFPPLPSPQAGCQRVDEILKAGQVPEKAT